jgi:putative FmdB family regulatory protein
MPIYEYRCASCGADFELTRSMSQSGDPASCPTCKRPAEKLVSSFASKADYAIKVPAKEPFRAPQVAAPSGRARPAAKAPAKASAKAPAKASAKAPAKASAKAPAKAAAKAPARAPARASAKAPAGARASKAK